MSENPTRHSRGRHAPRDGTSLAFYPDEVGAGLGDRGINDTVELASFPTGARRALVRPSSDLSSAQLLDGVTHSLGHTSIREDNVDFPWPPRGQASYEGDDHDNLHQSLRPSSTLMHLQLASTRSRTATSLSGTGILEEPLAFDGAAKRAQFREVDGEFPVDRHVFSRDDVQHLETMFETDRHLGRAVRSEYRGAGVAGGIGAPGHSAQRIIPQSSSDSAAVNELLSAENDIRRQTVKEGKQASRQAYTDEPGPLSDDVLQGLRQEYSSRDRNLHELEWNMRDRIRERQNFQGDQRSRLNSLLATGLSIPPDAPYHGQYPVTQPPFEPYEVDIDTLLHRKLPEGVPRPIPRFERTVEMMRRDEEARQAPFQRSNLETAEQAEELRVYDAQYDPTTLTVAYNAPRPPKAHEVIRGPTRSDGSIPHTTLPNIFVGNSVNIPTESKKDKKARLAEEARASAAQGNQASSLQSRIQAERLIRQEDIGVTVPWDSQKDVAGKNKFQPGNCGETDALRQLVHSDIDLSTLDVRLITVSRGAISPNGAKGLCLTCQALVKALVEKTPGLRITDVATGWSYEGTKEKGQRVSLDNPNGFRRVMDIAI